jgi:Tol biopolymer transport system component
VALTEGTRLGPYEIVGAIGAGGMGEVYKATDTRLNRTVAVKILPDHVSERDEMKARFDREAQTIAGLNHPNICTLHDVGEGAAQAPDGSAAPASISYLVMEYLEGETLADRLARGALPLAEALTIGIAIADALDKAHRQNVVHRDLKPANVMLTKGGPKLLDFGLAKWTTGNDDAIAALPTRADVTAKGTMLGTLQYMAPEQIEGKAADARTDIFAFGAMLYEMITGRKAFEGRSQATLISAIMSRQPKPMSVLVPVSPPALEHVVERCLAKEPDERWQSAHSLIVQLRWIAYGDSRSGAVAPVAPEDLARRRRAVLLLGLASLVAAMLAVPAFWHWQGPPPGEPFTYRVPVRGLEDLAVAPDGRGFVFVSQSATGGAASLYYRATGALTAVRIDGTSDARQPFFSPDSRDVAFVAGGALKRVPAAGGPVQVLGQVGEFKGGAWNENGTILYGSSKGLFRISAEGGQPQPVTTVEAPATGHFWPRFLPGGVQYVFQIWSDNASDRALYAGKLDSPDRSRLIAVDSNVAYSPGYLLYHRDDAVYAHPFDSDTAALTGEPSRVVGGLAFDGSDGRGSFDVSQTGVLIYFAAGRAGGARGRGENPNGQFGWVDRTGQIVQSVGEGGPWGDIDLSPDGTMVALTRMDGTGDIWILDWQRGAQGVPTRLTLDPANDINPVWSHDGRRVAFTSYRKGSADVYVKNANGVGDEEPLVASDKYESVEAWSRDGSHLAYLFGSEEQPDIWALPLAGDGKPFPVVVGPFAKNEPQFSHDGRWLAYVTNESGAYEVYVMSFPDGKQREKASVDGGGQPRWSPGGNELFYRAPNGQAMVVEIATRPELRVGSPRVMFTLGFQPAYSNSPIRHQWAVSPDGQRFLARAPNVAGRGRAGLGSAPSTFSPAGAGGTGVPVAPVLPPNFGLTIVLDWPQGLRGERR